MLVQALVEALCAKTGPLPTVAFREGGPAGGRGGTSKARSLLEWRSFYADVVPVDPNIT